MPRPEAPPALPRFADAGAFLRWAEEQPGGRFELVAGQAVALSPERNRHSMTKGRVHHELAGAIQAAKIDCEAFPDGASVVIDDATVYEPDAAVTCARSIDLDAVAAAHPMIVVEVLSPGSRSHDAITKLADYFRLPSIVHYLIVDAERRVVVHHRRQNHELALSTTIVRAGSLALDPPGLELAVERFFVPAPREL